MKNKIVFFGTPLFSAEILSFLIQKKVPIVGVVTQPDRPQGRSLQNVASPVKKVALDLLPACPVLQPEKAKDPEFLQMLKEWNADLYVVVAFGQILPETLLAIPPKGCINLHTSLLPKYRGAAPMQRCLMAGDAKTGVCIQKMVKQMDAGDIVSCKEVQIPIDMTLGSLEQALCFASKTLLLEVLQQYEQGIPKAVAQDHALVSFAPKITPEEGEIIWSSPALSIHNLIRAFSPRPGAWCMLEEQKIKILQSEFLPEIQGTPPGTLLSPKGEIACGQGAIRVISLQPEGKKPMSWSDWFRGHSSFSKFLSFIVVLFYSL